MNEAVALRPAGWDDVGAVIDLINREAAAVTGEELVTEADLRHEWAEPGFSPETGTCVAHLPDGRIIGYADYANLREPHTRPFGFCSVDPEERMRFDIGTLVSWVETRAREDMGRAPEDARITLVAGANEENTTVLSAWREAGFTEGRRFYQMRIDLDGPPEPAVVPDGYEIRPLHEDELWDVFTAMEEAFRDHYGHTRPTSPEKAFEMWKHYLIEGDEIDPDLLLIALSRDGEIAGGSLCQPSHGPFADMGWVNSLAVRPAHRRKGLAEALLRRSFVLFHNKGKARAGLGVDAESLTNATRLYEKCGMYRHRVFVQVQKIIREGRELANLG